MRAATISLLLAVLAAPLAAAEDEIDLENGEEINEVCATCHGEFGQGGKEGAYPRIAGQPAAFVQRQLLLFRTRQRLNNPMVEHTDPQELPDSDVRDISAYIEQLKLDTRMPEMPEDKFDAYTRLKQAERVFNVARADGDPAKGEEIYRKECRSCHGDGGWGDREKAVPMITGQFTDYLWRQVDKLIAQERIHDPDEPDEELLAEFTREEIRDIFAYLSVVDD